MSKQPVPFHTVALSPRAAQLFNEQQQRVYIRTDRLFAGLLLFEWLFGITIALIVSPKAWEGSVSQIHLHVWFALALGGLICLVPALIAFLMPGRTLTRHIVAVGQVLMSALLIHLTGGRIETHFHVFGSLAFLAFYRDWRVLITATVVVAGDHLVRGIYWPQSVYGVLSGADWRWLEHTGWVVFEDVFLIVSCLHGVGDMRSSASREAELEHANSSLQQAYETTIEGWSRALDLRDNETEGHSQRVTDLALQLAGHAGIAEGEMVHLRRGALLHDIGKIGIPDRILLKPGPLTDDEWTIMRGHPDAAYELLLPISFLNPALDIPYCHHEKWDGTGYPRRLKGDEIPLSARIFAIIDVWDALRSERPYREGWPEERVLAHIAGQAGKHFDPCLVELFLDMMERPGSAIRRPWNYPDLNPESARCQGRQAHAVRGRASTAH